MKSMLMSAIIRQAPRLLDVSGALARRGARDPYDAAARAMASAWWIIGDELSRQVDVAKARVDPVGRFTELAIKVDRTEEEWEDLIELTVRLHPHGHVPAMALATNPPSREEEWAHWRDNVLQHYPAHPMVIFRTVAELRRWDNAVMRLMARDKKAVAISRAPERG